MAQFLGFGNGSDGAVTLSGTDAPIDSSCSGSSGSTSLSATNASFATGQQILIHQTRGTSVGAWEVNYIASYVAGTITTVFALANTYTDSGASQAQVLVLKQYSGVTISGTLSAKKWTGDIGGIITFLCNGTVTIPGTIQASGSTNGLEGQFNNEGYNGGSLIAFGAGQAGEGTAGVPVVQTTANGSGGGGADGDGESGAGGGNASTGSNGNGTTGGSAAGSADLTTMVFGGGGGASLDDSGLSGRGGGGGAIVLIFSREIIVSGGIAANGYAGTNSAGSSNRGGGGGGAGGSIFLKGQKITLGTNLVTATGGAGGTGSGGGSTGGAGSAGRIRIETCSRTGSTNPGASEQIGGFNFCGSANAIIG